MSERLPNTETIDLLLARIEALIGLGASFPARRGQIEADPQDRDYYKRLWSEVNEGFTHVTQAGFPIANPNLHQSLTALWASCISFGEKLGLETRTKPRQLYADTITRLKQLREVLSHADAPLEVQREFRESALRTNELFVIMAFRPETDGFRSAAKTAAKRVGLNPVLIDEKEPENAISEAILSSIRRSTLVLSDLTFERPNCYFEAGFAKGAMRRVLFSCRADHDPRAGNTLQHRVHFDVDQFKITWWKPDDLSSATAALEDRLRNLLDEVRSHI